MSYRVASRLRPAAEPAGGPAGGSSEGGSVPRLRELCEDEGGATAVEYSLMLAAIAAAVIGTVGVLGSKVVGLFAKVHFP